MERSSLPSTQASEFSGAAPGRLICIGSLALTAFLCLPSLLGGAALLAQTVLYRDISEWSDLPAALIALGSMFGGPLVGLAALVGGALSLSRLPARYKLTHLAIVGVAAVATLSLLLRFPR